MGLTNHDASAYTKMRQQGVLFGYNRQLQRELDAMITVRREQPTYQSLSVVTDRKAGSIITEAIEVNLNSNNPNVTPLYVLNGSNIYNNNAMNVNGAVE
jgi:hypothetical protein